jgi:hypothetical protein
MKRIVIATAFIFYFLGLLAQTQIWSKHEIQFTSSIIYENPIYNVKEFKITFTAPSGREKKVLGFWDGDTNWRVRFLPDETGTWKWKTVCSDKENSGLHGQSGQFEVIQNSSEESIFKKGAIQHEPGKYYLSYNDGTPFFWLACTAWNGALKSTDDEWEYYLNQRKENNYNVIQLVTTEWRGCDKNAEGLTAIDGTGYIQINPEFFKRIDKKIDDANAKGLVVSPVVLWALPFGQGRHLSPGYTLPLDEAVLLAKYIVARYQGNQVIWTLGGDGRYYDEQELKWKEIGRRVFNEIDHAPVTLHPHGSSWVGDIYDREEWYDLMGYQSSHNNGKRVVDWINKGPMSQMWSKLKPMPYINMEPNYEEIHFKITAKDIRNASYWSLFATPVAGVTYGANGIWPWLAEGEKILNHNDKGGVTGWRKSIGFPGSIQMGYLTGFFEKLDWWNLYPANHILMDQPGEKTYNHWVSVLKSSDDRTIVLYIPEKADVKLFNSNGIKYEAQWFNPVTNQYFEGNVVQDSTSVMEKVDLDTGEKLSLTIQTDLKTIGISQAFENDMLLILRKIE